jgi:hypothetical protein
MTWFPVNPGTDIRTDSTPGAAERYEAYFKAGGAIAVGKATSHDSSVETGTQVIQNTVALAPQFAGVYEGNGGTGAKATLPGLTGNAAVAGDIIRVCQTGVTTSFVTGGASNVALQKDEVLSLGVQQGVFVAVADITTASFLAVAWALASVGSQGASSSAGAVAKIYVRGIR